MFMGISLWPKCTACFHASEYMRCQHSEHLFDNKYKLHKIGIMSGFVMECL